LGSLCHRIAPVGAGKICTSYARSAISTASREVCEKLCCALVSFRGLAN
jgi:hypothetical protein